MEAQRIRVQSFGTRPSRVGAEIEEALLLRAPPVGRGHGPQEGPGDGAVQVGIAGHAQAQRPGDREDPLAHGDGREHPLDEVRRYLDLRGLFLTEYGAPGEAMAGDALHISAEGKRRWKERVLRWTEQHLR